MAAAIRRLILVAALLAPTAVCAQQPADTSAFYRALNLEGAGQYRQAAALYRAALRGPDGVNAMLGLERAYAELHMTDSLLAPLDSLIAQDPTEAVFRSVQLRAYAMLARDDMVRKSFAAWTGAVPGSVEPYRDYARLLLQSGRAAAADSIIALAGRTLGTTSSLAMELAQSRAALGKWTSAADAWRVALGANPDLDQAAAFSLAPAPDSARMALAAVFVAPPVQAGSRRALAQLEMSWGSPGDAWSALRDLPPDSAGVDAWLDFGQEAAAEERWALARDAFVQALHARPSRGLSLQAAAAALNAGDPQTALALAPAAGVDSAQEATLALPIRVRALAAYGKPDEAESLVRAFAQQLLPVQRAALEQAVAYGWVRVGNLDRARAALDSAGPEADSSDAAGWLALYQGNVGGARAILRNSTDASPQLAEALGLITRMADDSASDVGAAFLALARLDSAGAEQAFARAAAAHADVAPALWEMAARIRSARHDTAGAEAIWARILHDYPASPEAPAAELAWARQLRAAGNARDALARLEHLILTYPESALVPQARRELELARQAIPGGTSQAGGVP
jgi:tetratricopeptide (TPR) repeat protein